MGRNLPSSTCLAQQIISELKPLSEMLSPSDRRIVRRFFEAILQQRVAIANASDLLPLEAALIILLVEERKHAFHDDNELYQQIVELQKAVEELRLKQ